METQKITIIVTTILLNKENKIFLIKRANNTFHGQWGLPGGKVKYMEKIEDANIREHKEELGIDLKNLHFINYYELFNPAHAIVFCYSSILDKDLNLNCDPNEIADYQWFNLKDIKNLDLAPNHLMVIEDYFKKIV